MTEYKTLNTKYIRPWGYYINLAEGEGFLTKLIHVNPEGKLSVQSHNHRSEHWYILKGQASVLINQKEYTLNIGDSVDIPLKAIHTIHNPFKEAVELIEIQTGDYLSEDDIIRYSDIYGRV
jgi:mannose-6-phosphate isomerase-like protein (cupin superfamily)